MNAESMNQEVKRRWPRGEIYLGIIAIIATIALCIAAIIYKDDLMDMAYIGGYSLLGLLVVAFIAGSIVSITAVPVPYVLLVFTLPSVLAANGGMLGGILAPIWIGTISAIGASLGQLLTFMIGYGSRGLSQEATTKINNRFYIRAMNWAKRHGSVAVFLMSAIINPLHLPMTIAMAALRFPPIKFLFFSLLGNMVKSLFIAFCGYFGLSSLFSFLGV